MILHNGSMALVHVGDCRETMRQLAAGGQRFQTCVTSPPYYGLRNYGHDGQIGLEPTPEAYIAAMVDVFRAVRDVLADDGTLWLNIGDSYGGIGGQGPKKNAGAGHSRGEATAAVSSRYVGGDVKPKDLLGIPWMLAFALRADGWYLRQEIIWAKAESGEERVGRCMPESVTDRFTKAHEQIFLLSKSPRYHFDAASVKEPAQDWGRSRDRTAMRGGTTDPKLKHGGLSKVNHTMGNRRTVWRVSPSGYRGGHFATFPPTLIEPCILAGSRPGDFVLDPFGGCGTTAGVALKHGRHAMLCELNAEYAALVPDRIRNICA